MAAQDPTIDFDCESRDVSIHQWVQFWDSTRLWLLERGYILYDHGYHWRGEYIGDITCNVPKTPSIGHGKLPYAFFGGDPSDIPVPPLSTQLLVLPLPPIYHVHWLSLVKEHIAFAQDTLNRHVVFKMMKGDSTEYRIARHLSREQKPPSRDAFDGIISPIDFLQLGDHWVVVMPRSSVAVRRAVVC